MSEPNISVDELAQNYRLASMWLHLPTGEVFLLRRLTDPKTLKGKLYFWSRETHTEHYIVNKQEWEPSETSTHAPCSSGSPGETDSTPIETELKTETTHN